jgi:DNA-binding NtrC family response regulator
VCIRPSNRGDGPVSVDRLTRQGAVVPVILMSSTPNGHAVPFLAKPFDFDNLLILVREVLAPNPT